MGRTGELVEEYAKYVEDKEGNPFLFGRAIPKEFDRFGPIHVIGHGCSALAVQIKGHLVLKLNQSPDFRDRIDAPVYEHGRIDGISFIVQPLLSICTSLYDVSIFSRLVSEIRPDLWFYDSKPKNLGYFQARLWLADPGAVIPKRGLEYII